MKLERVSTVLRTFRRVWLCSLGRSQFNSCWQVAFTPYRNRCNLLQIFHVQLLNLGPSATNLPKSGSVRTRLWVSRSILLGCCFKTFGTHGNRCLRMTRGLDVGLVSYHGLCISTSSGRKSALYTCGGLSVALIRNGRRERKKSSWLSSFLWMAGMPKSTVC